MPTRRSPAAPGCSPAAGGGRGWSISRSTALLGVWWVIGAVTVDDGYIAGIVRSRGENGFVGNVYRWLNAPESPFSWFYDLLYPWSQVSAGTLWMRLPATLLGLLTWGLLSRCCLPRLGPFARRRATPWIAALAFATWWVPLCLGLRPEPWVAVGLLGCWLAVERAVATRGLLPLALGLVLAGATTALTPGGLVAFTPFLAGLLPVLRLVRARRDLHRLPLLAALVAAPASAVLLMVYDQSLGAHAGVHPGAVADRRRGALVRRRPSATPSCSPTTSRARSDAAPRCWSPCSPPRARSGPFAILGAPPGARGSRGPPGGWSWRCCCRLAVMTFTPTKWTQHFGDLASSARPCSRWGPRPARGLCSAAGRGRWSARWRRSRSSGRSCSRA